MKLVGRDQIDHLVWQVIDGRQLDVELGLGRLVGHEHHKVLRVVEDAEYAGTDEEEQPHALIERVEQNKNEQKELAEATNEHGYGQTVEETSHAVIGRFEHVRDQHVRCC